MLKKRVERRDKKTAEGRIKEGGQQRSEELEGLRNNAGKMGEGGMVGGSGGDTGLQTVPLYILWYEHENHYCYSCEPHAATSS